MQLITTYENTDFDGLASMLAATYLFPEAKVVRPEKMNQKVEVFLHHQGGLLPLEPLLSLDLANLERIILIGNLSLNPIPHLENLQKSAGQAVFYSPQREGQSVTTLLAKELESKGITLKAREATLLALGIYEKTCCLTREVTVKDLQALSYLFRQGAVLTEITGYLSPLEDVREQLLLERLLFKYETRKILGYKVLFFQAEPVDITDGAASLSKLLLQTEEAHLALLHIPFRGNNFIQAVGTQESGLDLVRVFSDYGARGSINNVTFYREGRPEVVKEALLAVLSKGIRGGVRAKEIMKVSIKTLSPGDTITSAREMAHIFGCFDLPVIQEDVFLGMVSWADIRKGLQFGNTELPVAELLSKTPEPATPDTSLNHLLGRFVQEDVVCIPVVDSKGELQGIVSRADVLKALYRDQNPVSPLQGSKGCQHNIRQLIADKSVKYFQGLLHLLGKEADKENVNVYVVGGVVRDLLLGIQSQDLDLVVEGDCLQFARSVNRLLQGKLLENEKFGTAQILAPRQKIDFSAARQEFYAHPASSSQVGSSRLKKDLFRRDFTINTLAFQINISTFGSFYDFYNGLADIKAGYIRSLYSLSFVDDPQRIIRAVRFESMFNFSIEPKTLSLLKSAVKSKALSKLSKDGLRKELELIVRGKNVAQAIKRLDELGIIRQIFPKLVLKQENYRILEEIEKRGARRHPEAVGNLFPLYMCALLYGNIGSDVISQIRRLRFNRQELDIIVSTLKVVESAIRLLSRKDLSLVQIYDIFNNASKETRFFFLALAKSDGGADYDDTFLTQLRHVIPFLGSKGLIEMGDEPGPKFAEILNTLKQEKLMGKIKNVDDEIKYVQDYFAIERD